MLSRTEPPRTRTRTRTRPTRTRTRTRTKPSRTRTRTRTRARPSRTRTRTDLIFKDQNKFNLSLHSTTSTSGKSIQIMCSCKLLNCNVVACRPICQKKYKTLHFPGINKIMLITILWNNSPAAVYASLLHFKYTRVSSS